MKGFEQMSGFPDLDFRGMTIGKDPDSLLAVARSTIILPEKGFVLLDQASEQETRILKSICGDGRSLIV